MEDARRTWPIKPIKQCSHVLAETKATITGSASVCTGSSTYLLAWWLCGSPNSGEGCFSFVLFVLQFGSLSSLDMRAFSLTYCIFSFVCFGFCQVWLVSLGNLLFSEEKQGKLIWSRREVEKWEG